MRGGRLRVTVAIPCFNEARTVGKVVQDFRRALPEAEILVFDNASTDDTAKLAAEAGARVIYEKRQGKGHVIQRIFETVEADVLVLVDGDDTYYAEDAGLLIEPLVGERADMVVGNRLQEASSGSLNELRRFGNHLILGIVNLVFRCSFRDVLSGYRAVNREFLRSVPLITGGFEIETELTVQALQRGKLIQEVPIRYRERPEGSHSKLSPFSDGYRILLTIAMLLRKHRPLYFFGILAMVLGLAGTGYAGSWAMGWLPDWPAWWHGAVLAGIGGVSGILLLVGIIMKAIQAGFREQTSLARRPG